MLRRVLAKGLGKGKAKETLISSSSNNKFGSSALECAALAPLVREGNLTSVDLMSISIVEEVRKEEREERNDRRKGKGKEETVKPNWRHRERTGIPEAVSPFSFVLE